jgi:hypothetical protein
LSVFAAIRGSHGFESDDNSGHFIGHYSADDTVLHLRDWYLGIVARA